MSARATARTTQLKDEKKKKQSACVTMIAMYTHALTVFRKHSSLTTPRYSRLLWQVNKTRYTSLVVLETNYHLICFNIAPTKHELQQSYPTAPLP